MTKVASGDKESGKETQSTVPKGYAELWCSDDEADEEELRNLLKDGVTFFS